MAINAIKRAVLKLALRKPHKHLLAHQNIRICHQNKFPPRCSDTNVLRNMLQERDAVWIMDSLMHCRRHIDDAYCNLVGR